MEIKELADKIVSILDNKKAVDIELIPVAEKTVLADYFVVCSGTSSTHISRRITSRAGSPDAGSCWTTRMSSCMCSIRKTARTTTSRNSGR